MPEWITDSAVLESRRHGFGVRLGFTCAVSAVPSIDDDPREGDAEHTHADVSKATDLLGYEPTVDIREGVRTFIDWYRANEEWYDPLVRQS